MTKEQLIVALNSQNKLDVTQALLELTFNIDDFEWVQETCLRMIKASDDMDIIGLAITCIGHIARIYGKIDIEKVTPIFNTIQNPELMARIEDTLEDIELFAKN